MEPKRTEWTEPLPGWSREPASSALEGLAQDLAKRQVPVGRFHRARILSAAQAKIMASYVADWFRSRYKGTDATEQQRNETRLKAALELLGSMAYMRGAVMKIGQLVANYPHIAPEEFGNMLYPLHFEAPPLHFSLLREFVRNELGADPEEVFDDFEPQAFAAASLGQVHRARLKGSRERVAIKIQYPSIGRTIRDDFQNLMTLVFPIRLSRDWDNLRLQLEDVRRMLERETDYKGEAENLTTAREAFSKHEGIVIPRVYPEFSTQRVLTMDLIEGVHLQEFLQQNPSQELRDDLGAKLALTCLRLYYRKAMIYADPQPGNFYFMPDGRLGVVDFGCCYFFTGEDLEYVAEMETVPQMSPEAQKRAYLRAVGLRPDQRMHPEHMRLVEEFCDWLWEPVDHDGAFNFGNADYFRRGVRLLGDLVRGRHFRSLPVNIWLDRNYLGLRAMLYRLRARVNFGALLEQERNLTQSTPGG